MAINLGPELQRFARRVQTVGPCMQHRAAVAKAGHAGAVQQMGVDTRDLQGAVGTQPECAAAQLVDELEGVEVERAAGAGPRQQRLDVLEQRRHHELAPIAASDVEQTAPEFLDVARLRGQHIGNVLGQQPSR